MDIPFRAWLTLGSVSLLFFLVTALTFSSLGVVLPAMVGELHWSWSAAGLGFSLLGVFCGITSTVPAMLIRRFGARVTLLAGGVVMAAAFAALGAAHGLTLYFIGCSLSGLGFTLLATVPGTYLLARCVRRPDFAFGVYFTIGGLGGVAGPPLYLLTQSLSGGWRDFWIRLRWPDLGRGRCWRRCWWIPKPTCPARSGETTGDHPGKLERPRRAADAAIRHAGRGL